MIFGMNKAFVYVTERSAMKVDILEQFLRNVSDFSFERIYTIFLQQKKFSSRKYQERSQLLFFTASNMRMYAFWMMQLFTNNMRRCLIKVFFSKSSTRVQLFRKKVYKVQFICFTFISIRFSVCVRVLVTEYRTKRKTEKLSMLVFL